jgi:long-chain acyl-CoA synthetase
MSHDLNAVALSDGKRSITHLQLNQAVDAFAAVLRSRGTRVLATLLDNSPAWVVADLAAAQAQMVHVPLPVFFTPAQIGHALQAAGVDTVLVGPAALAAWPGVTPTACSLAGEELFMLALPARAVPMPPGTAKITFTSGTTGTPKGVCVGRDAMQQVASGIGQALQPLGIQRHLCVLPLAVLLENIAGVMAPLAHGAQCVIPPLAEVGLTGSSGFDPALFHAAVQRHQPHSLIVLPQMLAAWASWLGQAGQRAPACLRMVAVGGAAVGARLISAARAVGIPAYEGYGLSEGASVQTMNLPGADRPGTAGKPLAHARLRVTPTGQIEVAGSLFAGYLGDPVDQAAPPSWWPTGDLGLIDADGYLHVQGRTRNVLITAFARNVSPEWVESTLRDEAGIAQAVVFGDAQPALSAVIWPTTPTLTDAALQASVDAANAALPDYARVHRWVRCVVAFSAATGLATANGRPQRQAVLAMHADALGLADNTPIEQTENGTPHELS